MGVDTGRLRVVAAETVANLEPRSEGRKRSKADRRQELADAPAPDVADEYESPGPYIKAQRRRRGMSLEQLAAATKIPRPQLELLEADRFEELPGMVFAKGFLRCCARALDLDPDTVLGLLYERERAQLRKRRREAGAAAEDKPTVGGRPIPGKRGRPSSAGRARENLSGYLQTWLSDALERLPSARILLWIVVALFVALVVFIAFTLASGQAETMTIRS